MSAMIRNGIRIFGAFLFGLYIAGLIYVLFFAESYGRGAEGIVYDYNICPFREIRRYVTYWRVLGIRTVILNLAGNVIGFIPFGALLPLMARSVRRWWKVTLLGFEISALIEVSQLILKVGCFDVDDMILNTLGAFLGYLIFFAASRCYRRVEQNHRENKAVR